MTELADRKHRAVVDHLAEAAWQGMIEHGLDVTVEEIARLAGVSRRTVFRHVATRDELLVTAVRRTVPRVDAELPQREDDDWRGWLRRLCRVLHQANAVFGRILWELLTQQNLPPALSAVAREIEQHRHDRNLALAGELWQAAGLDGSPTEEFRATVLAHLGPLFTVAVGRDAGGGHELAATLSESAVLAAISTSRTTPS